MDTREPHDIVTNLEALPIEERKHFVELTPEEAQDLADMTPEERAAWLAKREDAPPLASVDLQPGKKGLRERMEELAQVVVDKASPPGAGVVSIAKGDLAVRFAYHRPDEEKAARHGRMRAALKAAAELVVSYTPASREQSLAVTKLEEAMMWANAAIAREGKI